MATLSIVNNFELPTQGLTVTGKQGASGNGMGEPHQFTLSGLVGGGIGSLPTATVVALFSVASSFNYLFYWADRNTYIQLIGTGTNVILPVLAKCPFVLAPLTSGLCLLAAGNTTPITGGTEPTLTNISSVYIGNYSGSTANYSFSVLD